MGPRRKRRSDTTDEDSNSAKRLRNPAYTTSSRRSSRSTEDAAFSPKKVLAWFKEYCSPQDPDVIGPEGIEQFCEDIGVEPENVVMLVLAWKMGAKRMGYFTLKEWTAGLTDLQIDSGKKLQAQLDNIRAYLNEALAFKSIYRYAYDFARDKDQRCLEIESARIMLQLLLGVQWSLFPAFNEFLGQSKYRVINKDQWYNVLEFSRTVSPDLANYDVDGAWPVMLDEFVEWLTEMRKEGNS